MICQLMTIPTTAFITDKKMSRFSKKGKRDILHISLIYVYNTFVTGNTFPVRKEVIIMSNNNNRSQNSKQQTNQKAERQNTQSSKNQSENKKNSSDYSNSKDSRF